MEVFHRRPQSPAPLDGTLFSPQQISKNSFNQAALIVIPHGMSTKSLDSLAKTLSENGFPTLLLSTRENGIKNLKTLVEDVQSGVTFMKSLHDTQIGKIILIGFAQAGEGALLYASASKQMAFILDGLMLINPIKVEALKNLVGVPVLLMGIKKDKKEARTIAKGLSLCKSKCHSKTWNGKLGDEGKESLKTQVLSFVQNPYQ